MATDAPNPPPPAWHRWAACDRSCVQKLHRAATQPLVMGFMRGVSWLSDGIVWYATMLLLPWFGGAAGTSSALRMFLLGAFNLLIYTIVKRHFARPRPFVACADVRACARSLDEFSFPSGHVVHAVGFSVLLCVYYPALAFLLWPCAALVALSRVVLGLHYPSDVLAGAALGWITAELVLMLF